MFFGVLCHCQGLKVPITKPSNETYLSVLLELQSQGSGVGGGNSLEEMQQMVKDFIHKSIPTPSIRGDMSQNPLFQFTQGLPSSMTDLMNAQEPFFQLLEIKREKFKHLLDDEMWMKWHPFSQELTNLVSNIYLQPLAEEKINIFMRQHQDMGKLILMMSGMMPRGFV